MAKAKAVFIGRIKERLFAKTVARKPEQLLLRAGKGKGEHAIEARKASWPHSSKAWSRGFGIAVTGMENMAPIFQFAADWQVIVDFPL